MPGVYNDTGKGPYRAAAAAWKGAIDVRPGDFIFRDSADGFDKPVSLFTWDTNLATTLTAVHDVFRGVSGARRTTLQTVDGNQITDGPIFPTGEFVYPCAALGAAAPVGTLVTFAKQAGNALERAIVTTTTTLAHAIGRTTVDAPAGATSLTFELEPALFKGSGVQAIQ